MRQDLSDTLRAWRRDLRLRRVVSRESGIEQSDELVVGESLTDDAERGHLCGEDELVVVDDFAPARNTWHHDGHDSELPRVHDGAGTALKHHGIGLLTQREELSVRKDVHVLRALDR